jgi:hypothetical protein
MRENHQPSHIEVLKSHNNNNQKERKKERKLMRERHVVVAYVGSRRELNGPRRWGGMML